MPSASICLSYAISDRMGKKYNFAAPVVILLLFFTACAKRPEKGFVPPARVTPLQRLHSQIDLKLKDPVFDDSFWGVMVQSLGTGETLYQQNAEKFLMPASNMKLITAAAALKRLGAAYQYETSISTDGEIRNGVLEGNLLITGNGDPTISSRFGNGDPFHTFHQWSQKLRALGISEVRGSIIGIDDAFDEGRIGYGWSWDDLPFPYATETAALQFAENTVTITILANAPGGNIQITKNPDTSYVRVVQDVRVSQEITEPQVIWSYQPESRTIYATGYLPVSGQDYGSFSIHNPAHYFVNAFKETLIADGIAVSGEAFRAGDRADAAAPARMLLYKHYSPPLREILSVVLKASQNLYAETLLKTLGNGKFSSGMEEIRKVLGDMEISQKNFILADGSGLSRYNYVTPAGLIQLLRKMHSENEFQTFFQALAVAGVDGTLRSRFKGTSAENNVHAKTGSLSNVRSLSGYATTRDGEMLAFVVIANNYGATDEQIQRAQDSIVLALTDFTRKN